MLTIFHLAMTTLIAITFPEAVSIISIISGTVCTILAITFPSILYLLCFPKVFIFIKVTHLVKRIDNFIHYIFYPSRLCLCIF